MRLDISDAIKSKSNDQY